MGSNYKGEENGDHKESRRKLKPSLVMIFSLLSVLISITGGSVLGWWLYKYHAANRQLWMVPFGLIFLFTPIVVWFSLIVSDLCASRSKEEEVIQGMNRLVHPMDDSLCDPKRWSEKASFSS